MERVIMIKYGELSTKKGNINFFIGTLYKNIQEKCDYNTIKEYLNEDKEKYSNFYFSNEGMVFCFNPGTVINKSMGVIKVTIPYK